MLLIIYVFLTKEGIGQSHGLGFFSHEVEAGKRTTLDLFPGTGFQAQGNLELSFELSFLPDRQNYFGHILHLEGPQRSIHLMYSKTLLRKGQSDSLFFKLVNGENPAKINFDIDGRKVVSQWNKIRLLLDFEQDKIIVYVNGKKYEEDHAKLVKSKYQLIWGISAKSTECPPMKIRNIQLQSSNAKYFWPLNEVSGNVVPEIDDKQQASVNNPSWIRALHRKWRFQKNILINGNASAAFNEPKGELYLIGEDSLITYRLQNSGLIATPYRSGKQVLPLSNQSVFNPQDGKLYNYYLDRDLKQVNTYNFEDSAWDHSYPDKIKQVDYQNASNFISQADTAIYIVGGYGHFKYKNTVHRYDMIKKNFELVKTGGDYFTPRYLAAAGTTDNGLTAYILGGFGSYSGDQILNPENLYDLMKFDVRTKTFKKIYDLKLQEKNVAFAGSMIIDQKSRKFSALVFPNDRFNSRLRMIQGSLDMPNYQLVGDTIPYKFHDVKGAANIYYDELNKQFVAVTLLKSEGEVTTASIYTLQDPPDGSLAEQTKVFGPPLSLRLILFLLGGLVTLSAIVFYLLRKRRRTSLVQPANTARPAAPEIRPAEKNAIFLFGGMQLMDQEGNDIAKQFTSLLRELFLYILIHTTKSGRGTSGEKLAELFWPDKSESKAKNNRDANLSRLKGVLSQANHIMLSKESGKWTIEIDYEVMYFDFHQYLEIVSNRKEMDKGQLCKLISISQRGNFLSELEYAWLDLMKSEISNEMINIYLEYAKKVNIDDDPEFLITIANNIFYLDSVNEEAIVIKCKALSYLGKHSLAKSSFKNFTREFKALYNEDFKKDFHAMMES